jgi:hypothetical protein
MTIALTDRARNAARNWRETAELRVSADPADVESVPYAEELWRCARHRA